MLIPYLSRSEDAQPLQDCVRYAATRTGLTDATMVIALTHFLEQLVEENMHGRIVRIPGFGMFAPVLAKSRVAGVTHPFCRPKFSASRAYRQSVMWSAPPSAAGHKAYRKHEQNHHPSSRPERASARTDTAMRNIRRSITSQMAGAGVPYADGRD